MMIKLNVNGLEHEVDVKPHWTLLFVLREKLKLKGVKNGCGEGECGACTVILDGEPVNSCMVLAVECDDAQVLTVEGKTTRGSRTNLLSSIRVWGISRSASFRTRSPKRSMSRSICRGPNRTRRTLPRAASTWWRT